MDLTVPLARGWVLENPVMAAAGTVGFGDEYAGIIDFGRLGAMVTKGVSYQPWPGNPPPRVSEWHGSLVASIGLQNPGVEVFCREFLPRARRLGVPLMVNVAGESPEEFARVVARLEQEPDIRAYEVNVSCPNVRHGGAAFGTDPEAAARVTAAVRRETERPLAVKLVPNVPHPGVIAQAVVEAGADILSCANAPPALAIDVRRRRPALAGYGGGLSGPCIKPLALRVVWEVAQAVTVPIIGVGGIAGAEDVVEFLVAGASAVAIGAATFWDPRTLNRTVEELPAALARAGFSSAQEAIRAALPAAAETDS